jgi:hypothetical protein
LTKICNKCFQRLQEQNVPKHFVLVESVQMMNINFHFAKLKTIDDYPNLHVVSNYFYGSKKQFTIHGLVKNEPNQ